MFSTNNYFPFRSPRDYVSFLSLALPLSFSCALSLCQYFITRVSCIVKRGPTIWCSHVVMNFLTSNTYGSHGIKLFFTCFKSVGNGFSIFFFSFYLFIFFYGRGFEGKGREREREFIANAFPRTRKIDSKKIWVYPS